MTNNKQYPELPIADVVDLSGYAAYSPALVKKIIADVDRAMRAAQQVLPEGWVPLTITYQGDHPEEVAYGPQVMMVRLKKWLDRYFEIRAEAPQEATLTTTTRDQIRSTLLAHGFVIKEGQTDLKEYVYEAAQALIELGAATAPTRVRNLSIGQRFILKRTGARYEFLGWDRRTPGGTRYVVRRNGFAAPTSLHHSCIVLIQGDSK